MIERSRALVGAFLIAVLSGLAGLYAGQAGLVPPAVAQLFAASPVRSQAAEADRHWEQLQQVLQTVESQYVDPISEADLVDGAIRGLVEAVGDQYSVYMDPEEYATFLEHYDPTFSGIGVFVGMKDNYVTVIKPIPNTPAERAGLRTGDRILAVDGEDVTDLSLDQVAAKIRGPKGSKVRLQISRPPYTDRLEVVVERAEIETPHMDGQMLDWAPGVGYIRIEEFNTNVSEQVAAKLTELRNQGMKALILDLRQNPGGFLTEAQKVASLFMGPGPVVHVVERGGQKHTYHSQGKQDFDLPMVILVDGGTASASEIVAGALQDERIATLVGTRTFGKGSVQKFFSLKGGAGLKLTTARYLTAAGRSIHQKGITPDVVVEHPENGPDQPPTPLDAPEHPQMQRAVELLQGQMK